MDREALRRRAARAIDPDLLSAKPRGRANAGPPNFIIRTEGDATMTTLGQELTTNRSALWRFFTAVVEISHSGGDLLARIVRIRRDRTTLDELPDYLLRDIGIERAQIWSITRFGRKEDGGA
ncbi:MAG: DUF1127 domain-containing protein [Mesorhizobium sp.]|nr:MAG: DUF1127 domain-containing protein [Mesorhizobium sp.]RWE38491.1 MAG: DUF1127 domain-containing protein [Mesorhizobium sp.]